MRRIRQWLLAATVAALLMLPLAQVASADPDDGGIGGYAITTSGPSTNTGTRPTSGWSTATADPGDGGIGD